MSCDCGGIPPNGSERNTYEKAGLDSLILSYQVLLSQLNCISTCVNNGGKEIQNLLYSASKMQNDSILFRNTLSPSVLIAFSSNAEKKMIQSAAKHTEISTLLGVRRYYEYMAFGGLPSPEHRTFYRALTINKDYTYEQAIARLNYFANRLQNYQSFSFSFNFGSGGWNVDPSTWIALADFTLEKLNEYGWLSDSDYKNLSGATYWRYGLMIGMNYVAGYAMHQPGKTKTSLGYLDNQTIADYSVAEADGWVNTMHNINTLYGLYKGRNENAAESFIPIETPNWEMRQRQEIIGDRRNFNRFMPLDTMMYKAGLKTDRIKQIDFKKEVKYGI